METTPTAVALGQRFVTLLEEVLSPAEWSEMLRRNATPAYDRACASHDFVDANVYMAQAFKDVVGRDPVLSNLVAEAEVEADPDLTDAEVEAIYTAAREREATDNTLWGAAWNWAKANYLTDNATSRALESQGWPELSANGEA